MNKGELAKAGDPVPECFDPGLDVGECLLNGLCEEVVLVDPVTECHDGIADICGDAENVNIHHAEELCRHLHSRFKRAAGECGENIHNGEQPLQGTLQLVGGVAAHFEFFRKFAETNRQVVDLLRGHGRKDVTESLFEHCDNADQITGLFWNREQRVQNVPECLDQIFTPGHPGDLFSIVIQTDRSVPNCLIQLLQVLDLLAGHTDVSQFLIRQAGSLVGQINQRVGQDVGAEPALVQAVLKFLRLRSDLLNGYAMGLRRIYDALFESDGVRDPFLQEVGPSGAQTTGNESVSRICGIRDHSSKKLRHFGKELLGFLKVTHDQLPGFGPSGLSAFLQRIHQLTESLDVLRGGECLLTDLGRFIRILRQGLRQDLRRHPLRTQGVVEQKGRVKQLGNMSVKVRGR